MDPMSQSFKNKQTKKAADDKGTLGISLQFRRLTDNSTTSFIITFGLRSITDKMIHVCAQYTAPSTSYIKSWQSIIGRTLRKNISQCFKNAVILTYQNDQIKAADILLTFGLKTRKWRKQFHRILEKELVFFLKKTTNFCTATSFDIHLIKEKEKGKEKHWEANSSYVTANMGLGDRKGGVCGGGPGPWHCWRSRSTHRRVLVGKAGTQIPHHPDTDATNLSHR